ncbi:PTS glucose transporter subunit IIA [Alkalibacterium sp. s-m-22]
MLGLFKKKQKEEVVVAPLTGKVIPLSEVPDPVFAQKMMGDGLGIIPTEGVLVSPVEGKVIQVFSTKHAVGIQSDFGAEILIHIGLETVNMNGEGFETFVKEGDTIKIGQKLITFDLELIDEKATSTVTLVVITNGDQIEIVRKDECQEVQAGNHTVMTLEKK